MWKGGSQSVSGEVHKVNKLIEGVLVVLANLQLVFQGSKQLEMPTQQFPLSEHEHINNRSFLLQGGGRCG